MTHPIDKVLTNNELSLTASALRHYMSTEEYAVRKKREEDERAVLAKVIEEMQGETPQIVLQGEDLMSPEVAQQFKDKLQRLFAGDIPKSIDLTLTDILRKLETVLEFESCHK